MDFVAQQKQHKNKKQQAMHWKQQAMHWTQQAMHCITIRKNRTQEVNMDFVAQKNAKIPAHQEATHGIINYKHHKP